MSTQTAWARIAGDVCQRILSGETPTGSKIASLQQLATRHQTSLGTVKRAIDHLRDRGVLRSQQGAGIFVVRVPTTEDLGPALSLEERVEGLEMELAETKASGEETRQLAGRLQAEIAELYGKLGHRYPPSGEISRSASRTERAAG